MGDIGYIYGYLLVFVACVSTFLGFVVGKMWIALTKDDKNESEV